MIYQIGAGFQPGAAVYDLTPAAFSLYNLTHNNAGDTPAGGT